MMVGVIMSTLDRLCTGSWLPISLHTLHPHIHTHAHNTYIPTPAVSIEEDIKFHNLSAMIEEHILQ